jgi:hypothetical protein
MSTEEATMTYKFTNLVASSKFKGSSYGTDVDNSNSFREQSRDDRFICQNKVCSFYGQTPTRSTYNLRRRGGVTL